MPNPFRRKIRKWVIILIISIAMMVTTFVFFTDGILGNRLVSFLVFKQTDEQSATSTPDMQTATPDITPTPTSSVTLTPMPTATPALPAFAWNEEDDIQSIIDQMSIEEKIGQLVIGGYESIADIQPVIEHDHLAGVLLFKKNIISVAQTQSDIEQLQAINRNQKIPLFISVDQEGGLVSRMPAELGTFVSARTIGDQDDSDIAYGYGVQTAQALDQLGFNLDFAPVLDIFSNPLNTVIGNRAYGTTPERVTKIGLQVIEGLRSEHIIPVVKHFPGHGDTSVDSHIALPVVNKSIEQLMNFEFKPFIAAIDQDIEMIMIAHILLTQVDDLPSSLSYEVVTGILRNRLGYQGVVITDDMSMGAITDTYSLAEASVLAIQAGCDLVLVSQGANNASIAIEGIKSAVLAGGIKESRIDESVYRILQVKKHAQLSQ